MYDSTALMLNRNRDPGSRTKGNDNDRDSKGALWKGQREANRTKSIDNPGESDNYHAREVFGNEGGGAIIKITGVGRMKFDIRV